MRHSCLMVKQFPSGGDGKVLELIRGQVLCIVSLVNVLTTTERYT